VVVLIILFASWLVFRSIGALGVGALATWQHSACYALVVMFVFTGIAHFNKMKHDLARMVPAMFPRPFLLVYFTSRACWNSWAQLDCCCRGFALSRESV
jgi:hypothetical protein